jgi:hypothetical protein
MMKIGTGAIFVHLIPPPRGTPRKNRSRPYFLQLPWQTGLGILFLLSLAHVAAAAEVVPYTLSQAGLVSTAVYDAEGRLVRELLHTAPQDAGKHSLVWDGLDRDGNSLPAGDYTWKLLQTPGLKATYLMSLGSNYPPGDSWNTACGPGTHNSPFGIAVRHRRG